MDVNELISSGLLEIYCLGLATPEERDFIEDMASRHDEIKLEIDQITTALEEKMAGEKSAPPGLKDKVMLSLEGTALGLPPLLSSITSKDEWYDYISAHRLSPPENYQPVHWVDLPGNDHLVTYIVWARQGASVSETHEDEEECLFMMEGACIITVEGESMQYGPGDIVSIPSGKFHKAEAYTDMLLIGQRIKI